MNILAIESSSKILSLALSSNARLCCQLKSSERFKSEHIIGLLKETLKKGGIRLSDLDYIAVGQGPGSFTGLRVGIASAKGLAHSLDLKIIGVGSLDLIAYNIKDAKSHDICTIVDARRGNLYAAIFRRSNSKQSLFLEKKLDYSLLTPKQLLRKISSPTLFVGDGVEIFQNAGIKEKSKLIFFASGNFWYPKASVLARVAYELIKNKKVKKQRLGQILPIYIYPKECQILR